MVAEGPDVYLEDEILIIDYHDTLICGTSMRDAIRKHKSIAGDRKSPVLAIGESAMDIKGEVLELSCSPDVVNMTEAIAIVPTSKVGKLLANIFITITKNPYPTKAFDNVENAKEWLQQFKQS